MYIVGQSALAIAGSDFIDVLWALVVVAYPSYQW